MLKAVKRQCQGTEDGAEEIKKTGENRKQSFSAKRRYRGERAEEIKWSGF